MRSTTPPAASAKASPPTGSRPTPARSTSAAPSAARRSNSPGTARKPLASTCPKTSSPPPSQLQRAGQVDYSFAVEGDLGQAAVAEVPSGIDRSRVSFEQGDATFLRDGLGQFDVVLMANLIDRLPCPAKCLEQLPNLVAAGGQLIIASPCTWLEEYTPKAEWLGGQAQQTLDTLRDLLSPAFTLDGEWNLPFLIREHARKYQWSVAQATRWVRQ